MGVKLKFASKPACQCLGLMQFPSSLLYGEGEALEWLEYAEYDLKPDGTPDPIPTLHRATDAPWLRRGPVKEDQEKTKKGKKKK